MQLSLSETEDSGEFSKKVQVLFLQTQGFKTPQWKLEGSDSWSLHTLQHLDFSEYWQ